MRTANLALVQDSIVLLADHARHVHCVMGSPVLDHFQSVHYLLTIIANPGEIFDTPVGKLALRALLITVCFHLSVMFLRSTIPKVLGFIGRHCHRCREAVASGVSLSILRGFIESANPKTREKGVRVIVELCCGPIPDQEKRAEFACCLLSVFCTQYREIYWLALIGISFWIENEDPAVSCFEVFWGTDTPFSFHFSALFRKQMSMSS